MKHYLTSYAAFASLILIFCAFSSAQSDVKVQILNSPPKAQTASATSVVKDSSTYVVWCKALFEDLNSVADLKSAKAYVGVSSADAILKPKVADFLVSEKKSITEQELLAGFVLKKTDPEGFWACEAEVADTAKDKATAKAMFTVFPSTCSNNAVDAGEQDVDCGGPCMPCSCKNKIIDEAEDGVDCGGDCGCCTKSGELDVYLLESAVEGDTLTAAVSSSGSGVKSLIRVTKPSGECVVLSTDDGGVLEFTVDSPGKWMINADLYGYRGGAAACEVKADLTIYFAAAAVVVVLLLVFIIILSRKRQQKIRYRV